MVKLLSWNVAGRLGKLDRQLACVIECEPDVVALQEITDGTYDGWRTGLSEAGYSVIDNVDLAAAPYPPPPYPRGVGRGGTIARKNFNLTASRLPIEPATGLSFPDPDEARLAFPEKYLVAELELDGKRVEVHNAHSPPGSSRGRLKPQAFRAMRRRVDERPDVPKLLCGDFNTPQSETDDDVVTMASRHPGLHDEWEEAEGAILRHPRLRDVYRELRQPGEDFAVSHRTRGGPGRYDHIYASEHFRARRYVYRMDWLESRLSDHAAVEADLDLLV